MNSDNTYVDNNTVLVYIMQAHFSFSANCQKEGPVEELIMKNGVWKHKPQTEKIPKQTIRHHATFRRLDIWETRENERNAFNGDSAELQRKMIHLEDQLEAGYMDEESILKALERITREIKDLINEGNRILSNQRGYLGLALELDTIYIQLQTWKTWIKPLKRQLRKQKATVFIMKMKKTERDLDVFDPTHAPQMWRAKLMLPRKPGRCGYKSAHYFIPGKHKHTRVERSFVEESRYGKKGQRYSAARKEREDERMTLISQMA